MLRNNVIGTHCCLATMVGQTRQNVHLLQCLYCLILRQKQSLKQAVVTFKIIWNTYRFQWCWISFYRHRISHGSLPSGGDHTTPHRTMQPAQRPSPPYPTMRAVQVSSRKHKFSRSTLANKSVTAFIRCRLFATRAVDTGIDVRPSSWREIGHCLTWCNTSISK